MPRHASFGPDLEFFAGLEDVALGPGDRAERACLAAARIRNAWGFRSVALLDVEHGGPMLVGASGEMPDTATARAVDLVVPVSSITGDLVGMLEVTGERGTRLREADRLRLEACAAVLWWLWVPGEADGGVSAG